MTYNLDISCSKDRLKEIRDFLNEILQKHGYPELGAAQIVLAVDEVCANLIIHSNHCNPSHSIGLKVSYFDNDRLEVEINDRGEGFDFAQYKEPSLVDLIENKKKGGLGLLLVKRIMDDIQFISDKGQNVCKLTKWIAKH